MNITIKNIHLENFKGAGDLSVEFAPGRTDIYGDNATGKTTVFDALTWLLFGTDSSNATLFAIKPLDHDGNVRDHALVTSVTATISVDGEETELRKEYKEKWTKKRGSAQAVFSGNETKCYIDGIPKTAKAYAEFMNGIVDEKTFRLLTDPHYFATVLDWKARRDLLMQIGGDCTDADVLSANPQFAELEAFILKHGIEDALSKLKADRTRTNKALGMVPVRIDEAAKVLTDTDASEAEDRELASALDARIAEMEAKKACIRAGMESSRAAEIQGKIASLRQDAAAAQRSALDAYNTEYAAYCRASSDAKARIELNTRALEVTESEAKRLRADVQALRTEYSKTRAQQWTGSDICPTCGQKIPADMVEAHKAEFNMRRSERLSELTQRGHQLMKAAMEKDDMSEKLRLAIDSAKEELASLTEPARPELTSTDTPEIAALEAQLADVKRNAAAAAQAELADLDAKISDIRICRAQAAERLASAESNARIRARIAELEDEQRKLSAELENIDRRVELCETFIRAKVDLAESRINSMFDLVAFKLYETQVNGGINPCCEIQVNGVTWDNLNSGMRILAGCDIIATLSRFFDTHAPVTVDNAEGLTVVPELGGNQLIRLIVSEPDKALRVEAVA